MAEYVNYVLGSLYVSDTATSTIPTDVRNFIAPPFPLNFWSGPTFTVSSNTRADPLKLVAARHRAAAAAIDTLEAQSQYGVANVDALIRPLERQVAKVADALAALEDAARAAESADAATPQVNASEADQRPDNIGQSLSEIQIAKNDVPMEFDTNLAVDLLATVFVSRAAGGSNGVVFGTWYRALQDRLVTERPVATRSIDYRDGRMSKTFMTTAVVSLQSCGRLYIGNRPYSAFEAAALCLHLAHRAVNSNYTYPTSFSGLIEQLPVYIEAFSTALGDGTLGKVGYEFNGARLPKNQFHVPGGGGRYERGALNGHGVLETLIRLKVLPAIPGSLGTTSTAVGPELDADQTAYIDDVNKAAAAFLVRAQNLFLTEDQTLLRSTINTITALLLLRRLLWNGNVYTDRLRNNFQLGAIVPNLAVSQRDARGASGGDAAAMVSRSGNNNFTFLCERYVSPIYIANREVELTQLFPGLAALCLDAQTVARDQPQHRAVNVSTGRNQTNLTRLIGIELENRRRTAPVPINEVLAAHDAVALQYERGLGLLMQKPRLRASLEETRRLGQFNVASDYDLLYFVCLGYIPSLTSAM
uniref:Virion protein n=1 Tax=Equid alphaherpesvirus 1 TaxID=10326 RepID=A0A120HU03_9ALPH|nr:virion protein [Equid alphaherpesvirus 1]AMB15355.1 virion protein [Equid alphaherpesvirus 1]AMB15434.1 virion protein [Equid alphaherpesvirus 1]AMB15829.1 virion protein [Equid alphaherpesvirus 1]WMD91391.1 DNA packaging tegument protein UL25 [Equid alphaherpesvirus 1]